MQQQQKMKRNFTANYHNEAGLLLLGAELSEAGTASLDGRLLVVLAHLAGIHESGQPRATLAVVHAQRQRLLDAILVVLHRLVVVGVVLGLRHGILKESVLQQQERIEGKAKEECQWFRQQQVHQTKAEKHSY
jgi:hypothetical protein